MKNYIGLDIHKKYTFVTILNKSGKILQQVKIKNENGESDFRKLFSKLEGEKFVAMEASSNWYYYYDVFEKLADEIFLAHPYKTKLIAESKVKTDKIDSKILADLLRTNFLPTAYIPPKEIRENRELLRYRFFLVSLRTRLKNRIHSILWKNGIKNPCSDLFGKEGIEWICGLKLGETFKNNLMSALNVIRCLDMEIDIITREIDKRVKMNEDAIITDTHPGIGKYLALLIVSEIGTIDRFANVKKIIKYARLAPMVKESGGKRYTGSLIKEGSKWLCWALVEAASCVIRNRERNMPKSLVKLYERVQMRRDKFAAKIALARKILKNIYYMLKRKEVYRGWGE